MGQGAATAITPQGRRTPTGLQTRNPAMRLSGSYAQPPTIAPITLRPEVQWKKNAQTPETKEKKKSQERGEDLKRKV